MQRQLWRAIQEISRGPGSGLAFDFAVSVQPEKGSGRIPGEAVMGAGRHGAALIAILAQPVFCVLLVHIATPLTLRLQAFHCKLQ